MGKVRTIVDLDAEQRQAEFQAATIRKYYVDRGQHGVIVTVQLVPFGSQKTWSCRVVWPGGDTGAAEVVA